MAENAWNSKDRQHPFALAQAAAVAELRKDGNTADANGLAWAYSRWNAEVSLRPLVNVHRRTLDDTWRQVILYFGGEPALKAIAAPHDDLVATYRNAGVPMVPENQPPACPKCGRGEVINGECDRCDFRPDGVTDVAPVVPPQQFIEDFMATVRGERPAPDYAGKTVYASQKARDEAASNHGAVPAAKLNPLSSGTAMKYLRGKGGRARDVRDTYIELLEAALASGVKTPDGEKHD